MKKLIALLAVVGFVPSAYAADGADASHSGEFRLQYVNNMETDFDEDTDDSPDSDFLQRLRWGTTVRAGEKLTGHFTLVHNATWGSNADQIPDSVDVPAGTDASGGAANTSNLLLVNEAYMTWMASDAWMIRAGRGAYTMADGRFVSNNDFDPVMRAFDGVLAAYDSEFAKFGFFGVRGAVADGVNNMGNFFGVSADFKSLPDMIKMANVHIVQVKRDAGNYKFGGADVALPDEDNLKAGFVVAGDIAGADYRLNYEMETGENSNGANDISTSMIDVEVGYTFGSVRAHFGYHTDSGTSSGSDDETYDGFHYDRHNNAGLMDVLGWGNLTYMRLGANWNVNDDIAAGAEYFMFTQTEKEGALTLYSGVPDAGDADEDDLGSELDLWVTKKYSNNFSTMLRYGMFMPGDEFGSDADDRSQLYLEAKLSF